MTGLLADWAGRAGDEEAVAEGMRVAGTFGWIPELGCASVAAVRGHAYGAGLQLALPCDFRIFAEGTRVGSMAQRPAGKLPGGSRSAAPLPEIRRLRGNTPGHGRRQAPRWQGR
jgi:enoyl-CoA hydratase/carnithine racemase